jgi:hypothetical protein
MQKIQKVILCGNVIGHIVLKMIISSTIFATQKLFGYT